MHTFEVEGVVVTDKAVHLHGVWLFGVTKRFEILHIPLSVMTDSSVLEALCQAHSNARGKYQPADEGLPLAW